MDFKRYNLRVGVIAIYRNANPNANIITTNMTLQVENVAGFDAYSDTVNGEIRRALCIKKENEILL